MWNEDFSVIVPYFYYMSIPKLLFLIQKNTSAFAKALKYTSLSPSPALENVPLEYEVLRHVLFRPRFTYLIFFYVYSYSILHPAFSII